MPDGRLHIHLDLDVTAGEVEGRASTPGGDAREFAGWVELLAAFDALIGEPGERAAAGSPALRGGSGAQA
jgi:hypothetical protein